MLLATLTVKLWSWWPHRSWCAGRAGRDRAQSAADDRQGTGRGVDRADARGGGAVGDRAAGGAGADAVNADCVAVGGRRGRAEGDGVARHVDREAWSWWPNRSWCRRSCWP